MQNRPLPPQDPVAADVYWMRQALAEAVCAGDRDEVPVGALVVCRDQVIGAGANAIEQGQDPTGHAEMRAIRAAARTLGSRRLIEATLYVTLEPCAMCAGAVVLARIPRLVFGAPDPKSGACGSLRNVVQDGRLNHRCAVVGGILAEECSDLLRWFFDRLRSSDERGRGA